MDACVGAASAVDGHGLTDQHTECLLQALLDGLEAILPLPSRIATPVVADGQEVGPHAPDYSGCGLFDGRLEDQAHQRRGHDAHERQEDRHRVVVRHQAEVGSGAQADEEHQ